MSTEVKLGVAFTGALISLAAMFAAAMAPRVDVTRAREDIGALAPASGKTRILGAANFLVAASRDAPLELRPTVESGYRLLTETTKYASGYAGNALVCSNCHFGGGMTDGGKNGGISLVGVASKYPAYMPDVKQVMDLAGRVNRCFRHALNGKGLPPESGEMVAALTYLHWIRRGVPAYAHADWLGARELPRTRAPDKAGGAGVYGLRCAMCHGAEGGGTIVAPPVWGSRSFTSAASMNRIPILASFVYFNMPRGNPLLRPEEAADVAAFVAAQSRPPGPP